MFLSRPVLRLIFLMPQCVTCDRTITSVIVVRLHIIRLHNNGLVCLMLQSRWPFKTFVEWPRHFTVHQVFVPAKHKQLVWSEVISGVCFSKYSCLHCCVYLGFAVSGFYHTKNLVTSWYEFNGMHLKQIRFSHSTWREKQPNLRTYWFLIFAEKIRLSKFVLPINLSPVWIHNFRILF